MARKTSSVSFHDPAPQDDKYRRAIEQAKASTKDKPSEMKGTPRFDQAGSSWSEASAPPKPKTKISKETEEGLQKILEETNKETKRLEAEEEKEEEKFLSKEDKLRSKLKKAIAGRVKDLDIGQYLMSGELTQSVGIIPEKLVVVYRTITDIEECYVDKVLAREKELTSRQFVRRSNEHAVATHIYSVNGHKWPHPLRGDGIDEEIMEVRLGHVRKLSSPIFNLILENLGWFLERVQDTLTMEVLGNG